MNVTELASSQIVSHKNTRLKVRRNVRGEVFVDLLGSGIHATYHEDGHHHFYDSNSSKSWREDKFLIALQKVSHRQWTQRQKLSYAEKHSGVISCEQGVPINDIDATISWIGLGGIMIYLAGKDAVVDEDLIPVFTAGQPRIFYKVL